MAKSEADLAAAKDDAAIEKAKKDIAKDKKAIAINQSVENFVGFEDPVALHKYMDSISFDSRKRVLEVMASKQALDLGAPPMARIFPPSLHPTPFPLSCSRPLSLSPFLLHLVTCTENWSSRASDHSSRCPLALCVHFAPHFVYTLHRLGPLSSLSLQ
jgi:hypothetical protein